MFLLGKRQKHEATFHVLFIIVMLYNNNSKTGKESNRCLLKHAA